MSKLNRMLWIVIGILTICYLTASAQPPDRDVIIFWDGTMVFGYRQPTDHPDIVLLKDEDGVMLSFNRNTIKTIMKERDLGRSSFLPVTPEFNFHVIGGSGLSRGYGSSAGFKVGYIARGGYFVGVTVLRNFGKSEDMHVTMFRAIRDENWRVINYAEERVMINESTQSTLNAVHFEFVRSIYDIRFRPFFSFGIARLENTIVYLDENPDDPDYTDYRGHPREGGKNIIQIPVGLGVEYPVLKNILIGTEIRYMFAKNLKDPETTGSARQYSFIDRADNSLSVHMTLGVRI